MIASAPRSGDSMDLEPGFEIRPMRPDELDRVIDFESTFTIWPIQYKAQQGPVERARQTPRARLLVTELGAFVASGYVWNGAELGDISSDGRALRLAVAPSHRGRGIGSHLLRLLEMRAREEGARYLFTSVAEQDVAGVAFAARRGYREVSRHRRWSLRLAEFQPSRFAAPTDLARDAGVRVRSFAEFLEEIPDAIAHFGRAHADLLRDQPTPLEPAPLSLAAYQELFLTPPLFEPAATFVALRGDAVVGISLTHRLSNEAAVSLITGVSGIARGRHVGLSLKLAVIGAARELRIQELVAMNDVDNAPTRRILRALGYVRAPDLVRYRRALARVGAPAKRISESVVPPESDTQER